MGPGCFAEWGAVMGGVVDGRWGGWDDVFGERVR